MSRQIERLVWFSAGILINSFGIVLITKGALGTSQISSIPYVLSLQLPSISFGMFSFIMNMVYIVLQALLLRRQFKPIQLLQIVVNVVFSASIDVFMAMLSFYAPQQLFTRVLSAVAGCIVLAFGISVEVAPDLIMVPGEGIVAAISKVSGRRFGSVKVVFDVTLILIAALLSWLFFGNIVGVGVGTLLSAVSVGQFVNLINRHVPLLQHIRALAEE
ncbi:MAG TPA: YitT family protein [Candidatus Merdibacter merdipullorum]|nr:YitT family protein [Candidatus Merdibacter merdipullorum]